jgi:hypothetical protein
MIRRWCWLVLAICIATGVSRPGVVGAISNAARTRANVAVAFDYQGATFMCEKIDGRWRVVKVVNNWIS